MVVLISYYNTKREFTSCLGYSEKLKSKLGSSEYGKVQSLP